MSNRSASIAALYRYPVKGLSPEPLDRRPLEPGETLPVRPRLCDRERAVRLRPGRAAASSQDRLPDADAERAAGRPRHPLRRRNRNADHPPRRRGRRRRLPRYRRGPARDRGLLRHVSLPTNCADRRGCFAAPGHLLLRRGREGRLADQPRNGPRHRGDGSARRSTRSASAAISTSRDCRLGRISSGSAGGSGPAAESSKASTGSTAAPPPTSIRVPAGRDLAIPRSLLEAYGHADCGVYLGVVDGA